MRVPLVASSLVLATLAGPAVSPTMADACNCIRPGFDMLAPAADKPAPVDTRIRVSFADVWHLPVRIVLRSDAGTLVPATQRAIKGSSRRVVEVTPRAQLAGNTRYEVIAVEFGPRQVATVVGAFHTAPAADAEPPAISWWPWRNPWFRPAPLAIVAPGTARAHP